MATLNPLKDVGNADLDSIMMLYSILFYFAFVLKNIPGGACPERVHMDTGKKEIIENLNGKCLTGKHRENTGNFESTLGFLLGGECMCLSL